VSLAVAIAALRDAYPRADFPDRAVAMYGTMLADLDDQEVLDAVGRLCKRSRFLPTIADIREEVAEAVLRLPSPEEAWDIATTGRLRDAAPEVHAAAEAVGGRWGILTTGNPTTVRAQFLKGYAERRRNAILQFTGGRVTPELMALRPRLNPTMQALPESDRFKPRPLQLRWMRRVVHGEQVPAPTDDEKRDAIRYLKDGPQSAEPADDALYREAELVFRDGAA
jgi:hypothetical protein